MLEKFGASTILAVFIGALAAVVAFLPLVAIRYRKAGQLRPLELVLLLAGAMYAMALWCYTLVPVPESNDFKCSRSNFIPFEFVSDIQEMAAEGAALWNNWALFQVLFNVVLFLPLGAFLRLVWRKGVIAATGIGFGVSLLIELTQFTGDWGLFHCAYRMFDVDDLMVNTLGALLGSLLGWPFMRGLQARLAPVTVTEVSLGRRLVGMLADVMVIGFLAGPTAVANVAVQLYLLHIPVHEQNGVTGTFLAYAPAFLVEAFWVAIDGRTCGEAIVDLRPIEQGKWRMLRRFVKFAVGVGAFIALNAVVFPGSGPLLFALAVATGVLAVTTKTHRGLTGLATKTEMGIDPE
ncbi:MAG: VanZ family protein [Propionibacteriaceae bacterium]|jgi:glycopeptide antibiotics resistance protein|nr:VanZ family protein [Propionibacteriaceae bacterium]